MSLKNKKKPKSDASQEVHEPAFQLGGTADPSRADLDSAPLEESAPEFDIQPASEPEDDPFAEIRKSLKEEDRFQKEDRENSLLGKISSLIRPRQEKQQEESVETNQKIEDPVNKSEIDAPLLEYDSPDLSSWGRLDSPDPAQWLQDEGSSQFKEFEVGTEEPPSVPVLPEKVPLDRETVAATLKPDSNTESDFSVIRDVALENYEEAPSLSSDQRNDKVPLGQKVRAFVNELSAMERILIAGTLGLIAALILGLSAHELFEARFSASPGVVPTESRPYPVRVTLPGGWAFDLAKGTIVNEEWSPTWAEWLQGTEICKWVALPWSLQLEAVVRSFESGDVIEVTMSNTDVLQYKVYSIERVPVSEISTLNQNNPSLLLILVNKDSEDRWVVTALP